MKKDQLAFLIGGLAFGTLLGYALINALDHRPTDVGANAANRSGSIPSPAGPAAPGQIVDGSTSAGGAPMLARVNELKRRIQENPDDFDALIDLGDLYRQAGMWEQADMLYTRAVQARPDDQRLKQALANLYHDAERWDQAISYYRLALEKQPDDPNLLTNLGTCYRAVKRYDDALALFDRAKDIDGNHWQALFNTVVVAGFDLRQFDRAEAALQELQRLRPDDPDLVRLRESLSEERARGPTDSRS